MNKVSLRGEAAGWMGVFVRVVGWERAHVQSSIAQVKCFASFISIELAQGL